MERITSKQVISMMDAVAQVYEQPEVEQLDEVSGNPVMPSGVRDEARKRLRSQGKTDAEIDKIFADLDAAAQAKNNPTPEQRKAQVDRDRLIQQAGGGVAGGGQWHQSGVRCDGQRQVGGRRPGHAGR